MLYTKFQVNMSSGSGEKLILVVKLFLQQWPFLILNQAEFYHSSPAAWSCHM